MSYGAESMAKPLRFHPQAADDLEHAIAWYEALSFDLSNRFRQSVSYCFDQIEHRSESFGRVDGALRAARVRGFPYNILFVCSTSHVEILYVCHYRPTLISGD
jgi:hypothetical protein